MYIYKVRMNIITVSVTFLTAFNDFKQVAQYAAIAHLGASILFRDTFIYDAQSQVTLKLKQ